MFLFASLSSGLTTIILQWTGVVALVLVGIFSVIGIFDKATQGKKEQADKLDDRLINLLKQEVEALQRKVAEQGAELAELKDKFALQIHENTVLREVMQGKDPETIKFNNNIQESMERTKRVLDLAESQQETLARMTSLVESFMASQGVEYSKDLQIMPSERKIKSKKKA